MWEPGRKSQTGRHGLPCQADDWSWLEPLALSKNDGRPNKCDPVRGDNQMERSY